MFRTGKAKGAAATLLLCGGYFLARAVMGHGATEFPAGYRRWTYVHSLLIGARDRAFAGHPCDKPCTGGILHFYANPQAMEGYRTGRFPEGSVLADELLELRGQAGGGATEGPRRGVGVMVKDSRRFRASGGWGFEAFDGSDSARGILSNGERTACFACHQSRKDHDYVFTEFREF